MIKDCIGKVIDGLDLSEAEAFGAMAEIMDGQATPAQIAALLIGLRVKGETVDEITGAARVMRARATRIETRHGMVADTCGTGGDHSRTFNISTAAAFVAAGAGLPVAKHGNRSVSSRCGSADVLEALGVNLDLAPAEVGGAIDRVGIGFLFAPALHGAMKHAVGPRREIGVRTIFNVLGPLTNPAGAQAQVIGVYARDLTIKLAGVMAKLGTSGALVVHGEGGIDELSIAGPTLVAEVRGSELQGSEVRSYYVTPEDCGLKRADLDRIQGGDPAENAAIIRAVLGGCPGPSRDVVCLNAGAVIYAAGLAESIGDGAALAAVAIDSGRAAGKLEQLVEYTQEIKKAKEAQLC